MDKSMISMELWPNYTDHLYREVMVTKNYTNLFQILNSYEFRPRLPMDQNAYIHGLEMRAEYCAEHGIDISEMNKVGGEACTILEMMVSLVHRICDVILDTGDGGNKAPQMFMTMLDSLDISQFTDFSNCRASTVRERLDDFDNGRRFLFPTYGRDVSLIDIWHQCHYYLQKGEF